jgi:SAM-dependent methyltransferase
MLCAWRDSIVFNHIKIAGLKFEKALLSAIQGIPLAEKSKCLDVGCGTRPYESLFPPGSYVGVDIEAGGRPQNLKTPDYYYDGRTLPFNDNSYDCVLCTQVLEHVSDPRRILSEIHRIVKLEGFVLITVPFIWGEHEVPFDFFRFSQFGITQLLTDNGFEVDIIKKDTGAFETLAVIFNIYLINDLVERLGVRGLARLISAVICFPIQILAWTLSRMLPDRSRFYLNLVIRAKKIV